MSIGEEGLKQAFNSFMDQVASGYAFDKEILESGFFSFIFTKKQRSNIDKLCRDNDWVNPKSPGITFTRDYFHHVLEQRTTKDGVTPEDCAKILAATFCTQSETAVNKKRFENDTERDQQALIFNAKDGIVIGKSRNMYGVAVVEVSIKNLSPVTAYHARRDKVSAFGKG